MAAKKKNLSFLEVIKDSEKYADDLAWQLEDGTSVTLGDLRQALTANEQAQAKLKTELDQQAKTLREQQQAVEGRAQELAGAYAIWQEQQKAAQDALKAGAQGGDQPWDWEKPDGYIEPVVKRVNEYAGKFTAQEQAYQQLNKLVGETVRWIARRQLRQDFDALPDRPEQMTIEDLYKYAMTERIVDDSGFPELRKAYDRRMEPARREQALKKAREEGAAEARKNFAANLPWMPRAAGTAGASTQRKDYKGDFDALFEDVARDPEIASGFQNLFGNGGG